MTSATYRHVIATEVQVSKAHIAALIQCAFLQRTNWVIKLQAVGRAHAAPPGARLEDGNDLQLVNDVFLCGQSWIAGHSTLAPVQSQSLEIGSVA